VRVNPALRVPSQQLQQPMKLLIRFHR
jgi:hypothetical protein